MRHIFSVLAFLILVCNATAARAGDSATVFPPGGCSADEERIITWKDGSTTTYCRTGQEILNMAITPCKDGEHVVFREMASEDEPGGRVPIGVTEGDVNISHKIPGKFVCEKNEDVPAGTLGGYCISFDSYDWPGAAWSPVVAPMVVQWTNTSLTGAKCVCSPGWTHIVTGTCDFGQCATYGASHGGAIVYSTCLKCAKGEACPGNI